LHRQGIPEEGLALEQRQSPQLVSVEIKQIESTITILVDRPFSSFCNTEKSVVPSAAGTTTSINDRGPGVDMRLPGSGRGAGLA